MAGGAMVLALLALGMHVAWVHATTHQITAMVSGKHRDPDGRSMIDVDHDYGMLRNDDAFYPWKRDSGRVRGRLVVGQCYTFTVVGSRWTWFSIAPNVITAERATC